VRRPPRRQLSSYLRALIEKAALGRCADNRPLPDAAPGHVLSNSLVPLRGTPRLEIEVIPGYPAGIVAGQTGSANLRPYRVYGAGRRNPNLTHKGRTAIPNAPHAAACVVDESTRNSLEIGVGFQRKSRPFRRIRATCPAGLTLDRLILRSGNFNHDHRGQRGIGRIGLSASARARADRGEGAPWAPHTRSDRSIDPPTSKTSDTGGESPTEARSPIEIMPSECSRRRSCRCGGLVGYRRKPSDPR
jgi:hypothetical protein